MQVGRKVYFDKLTGSVFVDTGERDVNVYETSQIEDFNTYPQLTGKDPATIDFILLQYGERLTEFANIGSMHVDPTTKILTIYPRLTITTNKTQITANGIDPATITASGVGTDTVNFSVNGGPNYPITPTNGTAIFQFSSNVVGSFIITAKSTLYGQNSVTVGAI